MLATWAADCAERALPLFAARAAADQRPRDAVDGLRAFARGELRIGAVRALAARAHAAAREVGDPAAVAAARAAGQAASVAHMAAHARGVAYAAKAAGLAAPAGRPPPPRSAGRPATPPRPSAPSCGACRPHPTPAAPSARSSTTCTARSPRPAEPLDRPQPGVVGPAQLRHAMILAVGLALAGKQRTQRPGGGKARQVGGAQVRLQRRRKRDQGPMATTVALCWMLRSSRSRAAPGGAGWGGTGVGQ